MAAPKGRDCSISRGEAEPAVIDTSSTATQWRSVLDRRRGGPRVHLHPRQRLGSPEEVHASREHPHAERRRRGRRQLHQVGWCAAAWTPMLFGRYSGCLCVPILVRHAVAFKASLLLGKLPCCRSMEPPLAGGIPGRLLSLAPLDLMLEPYEDQASGQLLVGHGCRCQCTHCRCEAC